MGITVQKDKVLMDPGSLHAPLSNFLKTCFNFKKVLTSPEVVLAFFFFFYKKTQNKNTCYTSWEREIPFLNKF